LLKFKKEQGLDLTKSENDRFDTLNNKFKDFENWEIKKFDELKNKI